MQQRANFSLSEANELAHALVAHIAREAGIRTLAIKGSVADRYGLRVARVAADADVLVEPCRFDEFCDLLIARGWHARVEREIPTLLGMHSVALIHADWPNDIDVHLRYPGFFADDEAVFNKLWTTRGEMEFAHSNVPVPSRSASAVIAVLHAGRHSKSSRHAGEWNNVAQLLATEFTAEERAEFIDVTRVGRAQWVLRELFDNIGEPYEVDVDDQERELWSINRATADDGVAAAWLAVLLDAPWARKPAILLRAVWISRADIPRNEAARLPTLSEAWQHRLLRWRRGVAGLINYARWSRRAE